ncbi:hypothetical protein AB0B50_11075 [Streptomyces sp. NPDC041068]|uniref:hypothetical protein n=1 Tax=Streptomyces sp. NPDC041068 TaxID=3155130 RepID=UPI0033C286EC
MSTLEAAHAPARAEASATRSLVRRGVAEMLLAHGVWLLYRWLLRGWDEVPVNARTVLTALTAVAVWVAAAGFLRGRADRRSRRVALAAAAVAATAVVAVVVVRPGAALGHEASTPALSALVLTVAAGLGLWVRHAESRRTGGARTRT